MNKRNLEVAVQKLAGTFNRDIVSYQFCTVDSVDETKRTCDCTPISGDATTKIPDVQLSAEGNDGVIYIPKIGSTIVVGFSIKNNAIVLAFSDLDKIKMIINNPGDGSFKINDGSLGGFVKVMDLTSKLNNLENLVNDLIAKYNIHTHAGVTSGGAVTAVPVPVETTVLTPTTQTEIENKKIIHGI